MTAGARVQASAVSLGLNGDQRAEPLAEATIVSCVVRSGSTLTSNCDQVAEAKARLEVTASEAQVRSRMRVENFPYFTSEDLPFFGICDVGGTSLDQLETSSSTCRIWIGGDGADRSLAIQASAARFDEFPVIVERAMTLLSNEHSRCD